MDYYTLTGIEKCDDKVKVTTLRSYLSKHMHNILQFSIGIRDDDERSMDDVMEAIINDKGAVDVFDIEFWVSLTLLVFSKSRLLFFVEENIVSISPFPLKLFTSTLMGDPECHIPSSLCPRVLIITGAF